MGRFSVRFYSVEKEHANGPTLKEALDLLSQIQPLSERQVQVAGGMVIRLERYFEEGGELLGEFSRVRSTDFPFEVQDDGVSPLNTDGSIGNGVAFRYRPRDSTLVMQYDRRIASPAKAFEYIKQQNHGAGFSINTKIDDDAWQRFENGQVRDFTVKIASPQHMPNIEDDGDPVSQALRTFSNAYDAPIITIGFGMGHRSGAINAVKEVARSVIGWGDAGDIDVRSLKAKVKADEDEPTEDINLMDQIFSDSIEVDYPRNDPEANYEMRRAHLKRLLDAHR